MKSNKGLPLTALDRVARAVAPGDAGFTFRMVPRATLARRRKVLATARNVAAARLSADESARVARLAEVLGAGARGSGSDEEARAFLFRPHPMLEGRHPIDVVLANEFGARWSRESWAGCSTVPPRDGPAARPRAHGLPDWRPDRLPPNFDATGSKLYPGRWNTVASPMIYASEHYSTAMLFEKLAHGSGRLPPN